jgi:hypothetical protein
VSRVERGSHRAGAASHNGATMTGAAAWEADVALADGGAAHIRPIRPDDGGALAAFHGRLSAETQYLRFFSPKPALTPRDVERFTHVDFDTRVAFVAVLDGAIVAVARYDRGPRAAHRCSSATAARPRPTWPRWRTCCSASGGWSTRSQKLPRWT